MRKNLGGFLLSNLCDDEETLDDKLVQRAFARLAASDKHASGGVDGEKEQEKHKEQTVTVVGRDARCVGDNGSHQTTLLGRKTSPQDIAHATTVRRPQAFGLCVLFF
jgi:hypothetical protein